MEAVATCGLDKLPLVQKLRRRRPLNYPEKRKEKERSSVMDFAAPPHFDGSHRVGLLFGHHRTGVEEAEAAEDDWELMHGADFSSLNFSLILINPGFPDSY